MGEVYRARDSKLKRDVAIKVLPQSLAVDPDALARFEREALAVAALSHQNILSIFSPYLDAPAAELSNCFEAG
jgi:serine/threonine protein kinase